MAASRPARDAHRDISEDSRLMASDGWESVARAARRIGSWRARPGLRAAAEAGGHGQWQRGPT